MVLWRYLRSLGCAGLLVCGDGSSEVEKNDGRRMLVEARADAIVFERGTVDWKGGIWRDS